jgi:ABC-type cobalamin/Fe3+-siderophores transport system ATPase subunit
MFAGPNGSGKSTLMRLKPKGLDKPQKPKILID